MDRDGGSGCGGVGSWRAGGRNAAAVDLWTETAAVGVVVATDDGSGYGGVEVASRRKVAAVDPSTEMAAVGVVESGAGKLEEGGGGGSVDRDGGSGCGCGHRRRQWVWLWPQTTAVGVVESRWRVGGRRWW